MTLLGAVEGYYGPPLQHEARLDMVRWLATRGYDTFLYAPKSDPYHRDRWREPYPPDRAAQLRALVEEGRACGVEVCLVISPGLDWRPGDEAVLVAKLRSFTALGARSLGVAWDDVPPGGADLGAAHGRAVAAAAGQISAARWFTCPTDYATAAATPYLRAFAAELPAAVEVMWTGPSVVSPVVPVEQARALRESLGRRPLFAENFPVNDGTIAGVLHLGPYPRRDAALRDEVSGAVMNVMRLPLASRLGLAVAARFWRQGSGDRERDWRECVAEVPGLAPLARACRAWVGDAGADPELLDWTRRAIATRGADTRLREFLERGCRGQLDERLAAEVAPWIDQWEDEAAAMLAALSLLAAAPEHRSEAAMLTALLWARARSSAVQAFGIRHAYYPVTRRDSAGVLLPDPAGLERHDNLTDLLCSAALGSGGNSGPSRD